MYVVCNSKPLAGKTSSIDAILKVVLSCLNLLFGELVVVISIQVEVGDNITEIGENSLTRVVARRVWGSHVGRISADDVTDRHFVLHHLVVTLLLCNDGEILMGPSVTRNLMTLVVHVRDDAPPLLVNGTLAVVVARNEKRRVSVASFELSYDPLGVDVRAVVVGDGNGLWFQTLSDSKATIYNASKLGPSIIAGAGSGRCLVRIAAQPEVELTVRCGTIVFRVTAVSLDEVITAL